jgi:putative transcriptional regulator
MDEESWIVAPATRDDVFTAAPEELWSLVLKRKGQQYALLSTMPMDPSLN